MGTPKHKIVIGIDFGTTYSGVSWAENTNPDKINPIRQWPDATGRQDFDKVPSEMVYLPNGEFKWGYQVNSDAIRNTGKVLQYMKLLLDPSQEAINRTRGVILADPLGLDLIKASLPDNKQPVDVVADYLRAIKSHALEVLSKNFGEGFWKVIPVEFHLTIPAVWSESAKALSLKAANLAGIGPGEQDELVLIAEPEAAALYCLTDLHHGLLQPGEIFVVVDCGGGTVDLVSYKVLEREPKLKVKEVAVGGGLCGSVFLNRRFESFVRRRIGDERVDLMIAKGRPYRKMMADFDGRLKRVFRDTEDQSVLDCDVPGVPNSVMMGVEDEYMELRRSDMREIFNPVLGEIFKLVQEQISSVDTGDEGQVSTILLVGGFGSSPYLFKKLKEFVFETYPRRNIQFLQPANAWSAIAQGAVICGLQSVKIESRRARRNYGVSCRPHFIPGIHDIKDRYFCETEQVFKCRHQMEWYVSQGEEIADITKIAFPFYRVYDDLNGSLVCKDALLASNTLLEERETRSNHQNVYTVCTLRTDLQSLKSHFTKMTNSLGRTYWRIDYKLVMRIHSAQLTFGFEYAGIPYGNIVTASFV